LFLFEGVESSSSGFRLAAESAIATRLNNFWPADVKISDYIFRLGFAAKCQLHIRNELIAMPKKSGKEGNSWFKHVRISIS
jgi:hypothetical protein